jgi:septal ring factor EnvC (AmiA/AmiB activator)
MDRMFSFHETVFSKLIHILAGTCVLMAVGTVNLFSAPATLTGNVTTDKLRVREKPDARSPVITVLQKGTDITIHNHLDNWYEIMIGDQRGFISDRFARIRETMDEEDASRSRSQKDFQRIQKQVDRISRDIAEHRTELESFTLKETSTITVLDQIDRTLNQSRKQADVLHRDILSLKQKIDETLSESEDLSIRIKTSEDYAGKRVKALYKLNGIGNSSFLMSAESVMDWAERKNALQQILSADERLLIQLAKDKQRMQSLYEKQKAQYADKETLEKNYNDQIQSIETEKYKRKKVLGEIRSQKKIEITAIEALNQAAEKLNATIEALSQENAEPFSQPPQVAENFISSKGLLPLPVKGKIVAPYGKNVIGRLNLETFRNGIDIQTDRGEPVQSVYSGRILYSEWYKGFGNLVIIDHGDHYYSVYGHLEERFKLRGEKVETRETIGTAGDTGSMTGTRLYFEIRHRGKPMDPTEWIKTG